MPIMVRFSCLVLLASAVLAQAPKKSAFDKPAFEAYVRHLLLLTQEVKVVIGDPKPSEVPGFKDVTVTATAGPSSQSWNFFLSNDGQKIVEGRAYDVNLNPFQKDIDRLKTVGAPSMGTPGAPVVIVLFSDFQCAYCKQEGESLRAELLKTFPTQVRVYFKDMPIEQIHPWAKPAALAGRDVYKRQLLGKPGLGLPAPGAKPRSSTTPRSPGADPMAYFPTKPVR